MTKRALNVKPIQRPFSTDWPPTCPWCADEEQGYPGWQGEPNDRQSPYIACGGNPRMHIRPEVSTP